MKFFLFNISELSLGSLRASDTGRGISSFCVPASKICNFTSSKGFIHITFDNAGIYEEVFSSPGDAIEKVNLSIATNEGEEDRLISSILSFMTSNTGSPILRFNAILNTGPAGSNIQSSSDINLKVPTVPISMETGKLSIGDAEEQYQDTIAGINFRGNLPTIDFNHEGLTGFADGATITSWKNSGTGGSTHNATNDGTPTCETSSGTSNISTRSAYTNNGDHFVIPGSFNVKEDYTIYCVLGQSIAPMALYGDAAGETVGFGGLFPTGTDFSGFGLPIKENRNSFSVRHSGVTGNAATTKTNNTDGGTVDYTWPKSMIARHVVSDYDVDVFIIRRDIHFNMFLHNRDGDIIGFIPARTKMNDESLIASSPFRTDGDLLIERLGTIKDVEGLAGGSAHGKFRGYIARFGVIPNDIGVTRSAALAKDLFNLYVV